MDNKNLILFGVLAFLLVLPISSAFTLTTFNNSLTAENLTWTEIYSDHTRYLQVPATSVITSGTLNLSGFDVVGTYPLNPTLSIGTTLVWNGSRTTTSAYNQRDVGGSVSGSSAAAVKSGWVINTSSNFIKVQRIATFGTTANMAWIYENDQTTLIANTSIDGSGHADFVVQPILSPNHQYYIVVNNTGGSYGHFFSNTAPPVTFPEFNVTASIENSANPNGWGSITTVNIYDVQYMTVATTSSAAFNETNNKTNDLSSVINKYVSTCSIVGGYCLVPFNFTSDSQGKLQYSDLQFTNEGYLINNITYTPSVFSLSQQTISLNLTRDLSIYPNAAIYLIYNNTPYFASSTDTGNTKLYSTMFTTPIVASQKNISFYFNVTLSNSTGGELNFQTNSFNQSVQNLNVDDCSVNTVPFINYLMEDEDTQTIINGTSKNTSIEILLTITNPTTSQGITVNISKNNTNPVNLCINNNITSSSNFILDAQVRYSANGYVTRFNNIQSFNLTTGIYPINVTLFDLSILRSQSFLVTVVDQSYLPLKNAVVVVQRKYIGENAFKTVESPLTDAAGQTIIHLVLEDVIYTVLVMQNGQVVSVFDNQIATCQNPSSNTCTLSLSVTGSTQPPTNFLVSKGVNYDIQFDQTTKTASVIFSTLDGIPINAALNVTSFNYSNTQLCYNSVSTNSGTLICTLPASVQNQTIIVTFTSNGNFVGQQAFTIVGIPTYQPLGTTGIVFVLILYMMLPAMVFSSLILMVLFGAVGIIFAILLFMMSGSIMGKTAAVIWFIVAGGIIIWTLMKKRGSNA